MEKDWEVIVFCEQPIKDTGRAPYYAFQVNVPHNDSQTLTSVRQAAINAASGNNHKAVFALIAGDLDLTSLQAINAVMD